MILKIHTFKELILIDQNKQETKSYKRIENLAEYKLIYNIKKNQPWENLV